MSQTPADTFRQVLLTRALAQELDAHVTAEDTEAQGGEVTCSQPQSQPLVKLGLNSALSLARAHEPLRLPKKKGRKQVIKVKERHRQV